MVKLINTTQVMKKYKYTVIQWWYVYKDDVIFHSQQFIQTKLIRKILVFVLYICELLINR